LLREIADDPDRFVEKQGWEAIAIRGETHVVNLRKLYESLQVEIVETIEALTVLRESAEYEIMEFCQDDPDRLDQIAEHRATVLTEEIEDLSGKAAELAQEIEELTGSEVSIKVV
jgi:hypothetical protein